MKKVISALFLGGLGLLLLMSLPYWPPTLFSALAVVVLMAALALVIGARFFPSRRMTEIPLLDEEELAELAALDEQMGEEPSIEVPAPIIAAVQSREEQLQAQNRANNLKKKRRTRKRLSKKSRRNNRKH